MIEKQLRKKSILFAIFFTFFVDTLGATIIFPIFSPLFLTPEHMIVSASVSYSIRAMLLGLFLAAFPLAQFIVAPLVGEYADHHGRKRALLITTMVTLIGYMLAAWSIAGKHLYLIFLSRLLMGAASGNLSICLSSIADISTSAKEKTRYYGLGSAIAGATFVLGPFIGGKLSDHTLYPIFNNAFPMWVGAGLTLLNLIFIIAVFKETIEKSTGKIFSLERGWQNIQLAFKTPSIRRLYTVFFFYLISWNFLFQFVPAFLIQRFNSSTPQIGDICAILGGCWIVGTMVLSKLLIHRIRHKILLITASIAFSLFTIIAFFIHNLWPFTTALGAAVFFASFSWPICAGAISTAAKGGIQGKVMGMSQSMQSLAMLIAPILGGPALSAHIGVSFGLAAVFSVIYGVLLIHVKIQDSKKE